MKTKKICSALLSFALSASVLLPLCEKTVRADDGGIISGDRTWSYSDQDHVLTISGYGRIDDFSGNEPWRIYKNEIQKVVIEDGIVYLGANAFSYYTSITEVTFPTSLESIGVNAFGDCSGLSTINFAEGLTKIDGSAFSGCTSLSDITLPASLETIGGSAFNGSGLLSITIPDGVTEIGTFAFSGSADLAEVTIGKNVTKIEADAFYGCENVDKVTCYANPSTLTWDENGCDDFKEDKGTYCYVPAEYYQGYLSDDFAEVNLTFKKLEITGTCGDNATWVYDNAGKLTISGTGAMDAYTTTSTAPWDDFKTEITEVDIEQGVTTIGSYAFNGCSALTKIGIPEGITSIGSNAFLGCSALTTFSIPSTVTNIGADAFKGCTSVDEFDCNANPASLTWTDNGCDDFKPGKETVCHVLSNDLATYKDKFSTGDTTTDVNVKFDIIILDSGNCGIDGDNVTWALNANGTLDIKGSGAMANYTNATNTPWANYRNQITAVIIGSGVTTLGDYAFSNTAVSNVSIADTVTQIGTAAFSNCSSLTSITIPNGVTTIGQNAFSVSGLKSIDLPDSVTSIMNSAFASCSNLASVNIPDNVIRIGISAFSSCSSLTSITIPGSVERIDNQTFKDCSKLETVTLCEGTMTIGEEAFTSCTSLTSITLPEGFTTIENNAFNNCISMTTITIPSTVTLIDGYDTFYDCTSVTDVYCYANPAQLTWDEGGYLDDFNDDGTTKCHVYEKYYESWLDFSNKVNLTFVGDILETIDMGIGEHLVGYTLSLEGDVGVNFYMELDDDVISKGTAKMVFTVGSGTQEVDLASAKKVTGNDGKEYYLFKCHVAAKEMTDTITAQMVDGETQGTAYTYSVQQYAKYILDNPTKYSKEQALVKAMLNYGAYAQKYFSYNTNNLANAIITPASAQTVSVVDASSLSAYSGNGSVTDAITLVSANLVLESEVTMRLSFTGIPEGTTFRLKGSDEDLSFTSSSKKTVVSINNIPADKLNTDYTVCLYNGTTLIGSISYSPVNYCYNVISRPLTEVRTESLREVVSALYLYNQAAVDYRSN